MIVIGRGFVAASEQKNQAEAEYRYVLTRLHENGESIALLGGEQEERAGLDRSLRQVLRRGRQLCSPPPPPPEVSPAGGVGAAGNPRDVLSAQIVAWDNDLGEVLR